MTLSEFPGSLFRKSAHSGPWWIESCRSGRETKVRLWPKYGMLSSRTRRRDVRSLRGPSGPLLFFSVRWTGVDLGHSAGVREKISPAQRMISCLTAFLYKLFCLLKANKRGPSALDAERIRRIQLDHQTELDPSTSN